MANYTRFCYSTSIAALLPGKLSSLLLNGRIILISKGGGGSQQAELEWKQASTTTAEPSLKCNVLCTRLYFMTMPFNRGITSTYIYVLTQLNEEAGKGRNVVTRSFLKSILSAFANQLLGLLRCRAAGHKIPLRCD